MSTPQRETRATMLDVASGALSFVVQIAAAAGLGLVVLYAAQAPEWWMGLLVLLVWAGWISAATAVAWHWWTEGRET